MSYTTITARITDQTLQLINTPLLASGGVDEIQISCTFCHLWDGYVKTAAFYRKDGPVFHVAMVDDTVTVPWEVLTEAGDVYFGIMGVATNTRTTEVVQIHISQGAITTSSLPTSEPTPDVYTQLLENYAAMLDYIESSDRKTVRSYTIETEAEFRDVLIAEAETMTAGSERMLYFNDTSFDVFHQGGGIARLYVHEGREQRGEFFASVELCCSNRIEFLHMARIPMDGTWQFRDRERVMTTLGGTILTTGWSYQKESSGKFEAWCSAHFIQSRAMDQGDMDYHRYVYNCGINLPFPSTTTPLVFVSPHTSGGLPSIKFLSVRPGLETQELTFASTHPGPSLEIDADIYVIGTWR